MATDSRLLETLESSGEPTDTEPEPEEDEELKEKEELAAARKREKEARRERRREKRREIAAKKQKQQEADAKEQFEHINGLARLVLNTTTQQLIDCIVGEHVTSQFPWKVIDKDSVETDLITNSETSDFLPLQDDINKYEPPEMLIGYIPNEESEIDEFYLCVTEEARDIVSDLVEKAQLEQEARLQSSIFRKIKRWRSYGSEKELLDFHVGNLRNLYEVEVESAYPIMVEKTRFGFRRVDAVDDGYSELLWMDYLPPLQIVHKLRIDNGAQCIPPMIHQEVQTNPTFPANQWTTYEFSYKPIKTLKQDFIKNFTEFREYDLEPMIDDVLISGYVDMYRNDYAPLVLDSRFARSPPVMEKIRFMNFMDVIKCKNKLVIKAEWHPSITGLVLITYADHPPNVLRSGPSTEDPIIRAVHGTNPVLLWSCVDPLKPRLVLESNREVLCAVFCPHNPNIVVGGCINGQIIVWDLTGKLERAEQVEFLTPAQQRYRFIMNDLMGWYKNIRDLSLVRPAAVSALEYSHYRAITCIEWIPHDQVVSKTGRITKKEVGKASMQFITGSEDGTILFWDLLLKPTPLQGVVVRPKRRSHRLSKRPSALALDFSPFKSLHRLLRPHFKINLAPKEEGRQNIPISSVLFVMQKHPIEMEPETPIDKETFQSSKRYIFKQTPVESDQVVPSKMVIGTINGEVLFCTFEGHDFNTGELINSENFRISIASNYHDGPVCVLKRSVEFNDVILSIGGKSFALWKQGFQRPILWRRSVQKYIYGQFNLFFSLAATVCRSDGTLELWDFYKRSDRPVNESSLSGKPLTYLNTNPYVLPTNLIGVADSNAAYTMYRVPPVMEIVTEGANQQSMALLDREIERKAMFTEWQTHWTQKFATWIQEQKEMEEEMKKQKEAQERTEREMAAQLEQIREEEERRIAREKMHPPPGKYIEWAQERWLEREGIRMNRVLLDKKRLKKSILEKQQIPLQKLAMQEKRKKQKQEERLGQASKVFEETISTMLPKESEMEDTVVDIDYYSEENKDVFKEVLMEKYDQSVAAANQYIKETPYVFKFDWTKSLEKGHRRRCLLDVELYMDKAHEQRFARDKHKGDGAFSSSMMHTSAPRPEPQPDFIEEQPGEFTDEDVNLQI